MQMHEPEARNPLIDEGESKIEIAPELYKRMNSEQRAKFARVTQLGKLNWKK